MKTKYSQEKGIVGRGGGVEYVCWEIGVEFIGKGKKWDWAIEESNITRDLTVGAYKS